MALVDESKKRKNVETAEGFNIAIDDDDLTQTLADGAMSDTSASVSTSSSGINLILDKLAAMERTAAGVATEEGNWRLVQAENHAAVQGEMTQLTKSIKGIEVKVVNLQADFLALKGRVCAIEAGPVSKGKGKATTPRETGDPWTALGADPWQRYNHVDHSQREAPLVNLTPSTTSSGYVLEPRVGDRSTVICGGFPEDTARADIEQAMREYVKGHEGIVRVGSLGKYGAAGRINFTDKSAMWDFIRYNKRKKFDFDGMVGAIWFAIEKTDTERKIGSKVSYLVRTVVEYIKLKGEMPHVEAVKFVDADYGRGISCTSWPHMNPLATLPRSSLNVRRFTGSFSTARMESLFGPQISRERD